MNATTTRQTPDTASRLARHLAVFVTASAAGLLEAWGRRSRATRLERRKALPGDEIVPHPKWEATRATTIRATREEVWPWLVQMGFPTHRAGWYTPFWLDRLLLGITAHSADSIVPELQNLAVGDRVPDSDDSDVSFFTVARLDPPHALVLHSSTHPLPAYTEVNFAWAFVLEEEGRDTRLIVRARVDYTPVWPPAIVRALMLIGFGIGDFIQAGGMLEGIKRRIKRGAGARLDPPRPGRAAVDLYWIPLGAGGHCVRFNGKVFEALEAARQHRARDDLYHAALIVALDGEQYTIELAPSPDADEPSRGVVATGPVGSRLIGRLRLFRYEVRCWPGGSIPDLHYAVGAPHRLTTDPHAARELLEALPNVPTPVWGRDELKTGDMWNSNSLISWSLAATGLATDQLHPPPHGRAPGWDAGLALAQRATTRNCQPAPGDYPRGQPARGEPDAPGVRGQGGRT